MTSFLSEDFLLRSDFAKRLYHEVAADLPIIDYHCHLLPHQVSEDYKFQNLTDIWLRGDHYKWRAMRINGVDERFCTGDATDKEKFLAFARTVPYTIGNPIYHWAHLELRRPFGISDIVLNEDTAERVWNETNEMLATPEFSARSIMQKMNVEMVGTTDDPIDDLAAHKKVADDKDFPVQMLPSWRPDKAFNIHQDTFPAYIEALSKAADVEISRFTDLCSALDKRLQHFADHGCCISDHALDTVCYEDSTEQELDAILSKRLSGGTVSEIETAQFKTAVLVYLGKQYAKRGWVQQYHIGALRNNNQRMFKLLGPDVGFDSIHDGLVALPLSRLLDALDRDNALPKTILYGLNPRDNEVLATMCGNFQDGSIAGKIQFGSGWWFNDQKDGMERQMTQLAQLGLLSRFVGMLTDSRSFLSYTRHEYFRRILCQMIGKWVEDGEAPADFELLSRMVRDICYYNAKNYFGITAK
ncbi:glucuronate isomerase [Vibrio diazotrophicus]|jgi:glucuronate isomerase|uniref:Uronate isomerase n=1 Tax=Vibrio diazotrophicus TaxID=685 RepID=A0A2J8I879_VIBDI|nr:MULTISPECIES: glucuronate isomerase [Vibrio]MCF7362135.1 glucuronate isomerase [Vibrio sp. A1-b2]PNI06730.1 glucuronate isomerase [Vibrio diazotrophicus]